MRTPYLSPLLIGALLSLYAPFVKAAGPEPMRLMAVTELKADETGHYITIASINGSDIRVLVDTGATAVALSYEDAENAGLKPRHLDYDVPVSTANGVTKAARVTLDRIEVDGIRLDDVDGLVLPEGVFDGTLLGMSFLGRLQSFRVENGVLYLKN